VPRVVARPVDMPVEDRNHVVLPNRAVEGLLVRRNPEPSRARVRPQNRPVKEDHDGHVGAEPLQVPAQPLHRPLGGLFAQRHHVQIPPVHGVLDSTVAPRHLPRDIRSAAVVVIAHGLRDSHVEQCGLVGPAVHRYELLPLLRITVLREIPGQQHAHGLAHLSSERGGPALALDRIRLVDDVALQVEHLHAPRAWERRSAPRCLEVGPEVSVRLHQEGDIQRSRPVSRPRHRRMRLPGSRLAGVGATAAGCRERHRDRGEDGHSSESERRVHGPAGP